MITMTRFTRAEVYASIDSLKKRYKSAFRSLQCTLRGDSFLRPLCAGFSEFMSEFAQFLGDVDRQLMLLMKTVYAHPIDSLCVPNDAFDSALCTHHKR